jgi:hypothetical protein
VEALKTAAALHAAPGAGPLGAPPHAKVTLATTADKLADTGKVGGLGVWGLVLWGVECLGVEGAGKVGG